MDQALKNKLNLYISKHQGLAALNLMDNIVKKYPNDVDAAIQYSYLLLAPQWRLHKFIPQLKNLFSVSYEEKEKMNDTVIQYFQSVQPQLATHSTYLLFIGMLCAVSCLLNITNPYLKSKEMLGKALAQHPNEPLYQLFGMEPYNQLQAYFLAKKILYQDHNKTLNWLQSKGLPGQYVMAHIQAQYNGYHRFITKDQYQLSQWKPILAQYRKQNQWRQCVALLSHVVKQYPKNVDAAISYLYYLHDIFLDEGIYCFSGPLILLQEEWESVRTTFKTFFETAYAQFSDHPEFLLFMGLLLTIAPFMFDLNVDEAFGYDMQRRALKQKPGHLVYELFGMHPYNPPKAYSLAKQILDNQPLQDWLKSKGFPGEYMLFTHIHGTYRKYAKKDHISL